MEFQWDDKKAEINIKSHGVDFKEAKEIFYDDFALDIFDYLHTDFIEQRFQILGLTRKSVLLVVYTIRDEEIYRIISARKATKAEEKAYWNERKKYE